VANIFENKDRRVIPNWRSFKKTVHLGELDNINLNTKSIEPPLSIDHYIEDWKENKTLSYAGDLMSAASLNGHKKNDIVLTAAKFVIDNSEFSTKSQISLANIILETDKSNNIFQKLENISVDDFPAFIDRELIWKRIQDLKKAIFQYPFNPIYYVELSRNYSILGQSKQAIESMKIALQFSKENRFVLRSAIRLFAHYDEIEIAHDLLRKNRLTNIDPWLTSSEIALATLRGRTSRFMKKGEEMINSKNLSPFSITELASSLATVELLNGAIKKTRLLFKSALIAPNDNTLAQIEWASKKDKSLGINPTGFNVNHNFEALALDKFNNGELEEALDNTTRWFLDMPFSKRPVMFGSHIASSLLNDQEKSRAFLKAGLISHPNDPQIINNLVYSLALENRIEDAMEYLSKTASQKNIEKSTEICLKATRGLIHFRTGFHELGRLYYREAIGEAGEIKSAYYSWLAILNYAREEILIKSEYVTEVMEAIAQIPQNLVDLDIEKLKNEVIELYKTNKDKS
jgi:hypothetical protein